MVAWWSDLIALAMSVVIAGGGKSPALSDSLNGPQGHTAGPTTCKTTIKMQWLVIKQSNG